MKTNLINHDIKTFSIENDPKMRKRSLETANSFDVEGFVFQAPPKHLLLKIRIVTMVQHIIIKQGKSSFVIIMIMIIAMNTIIIKVTQGR